MSDNEGRSRGFGFVEFADPNMALNAIKNMNGVELNGRTMRVNYSSNSHLEGLASKLGLDMSRDSVNAQTNKAQGNRGGHKKRDPSSSGGGGGGPRGDRDDYHDRGADRVAEAIKQLSKHEMYTILSELKMMASKDQEEARALLTSHPQLPEALLHIMSKVSQMRGEDRTVVCRRHGTTRHDTARHPTN